MSGQPRFATGFARGKVILLGEHSVVHGTPALAMGMDRGVEIRALSRGHGLGLSIEEWGLKARSDGAAPGDRALAALASALGVEQAGISLEGVVALPPRAGLGASAAMGAAAARAITELLERDVSFNDLFAAVQASERIFHGNPSGLDAAVALEGGLIRFSKDDGPRNLNADRPPIVIVNSREHGDTRRTVGSFADKLESGGGEGRRRLARMGELVKAGIEALKHGDLSLLGGIMNENQLHLSWFGVSTPSLDSICKTALAAGALGAKLTGGGGGGCAIALTSPESLDEVSGHLDAAGLDVVGTP